MTHRLNNGITAMVLAVVVGMASAAWANELPPEPGEAFLVNEEANLLVGLYVREYSVAGNGIIDYRTARQILASEQNAYGNAVVETKEFALFYWYDADQDGDFEQWIDREVNGCTCDIVRYDVQGQMPSSTPATLISNPWLGIT